MDKLPNEVAAHILIFCNYTDIMSFRQTSKLNYEVAQYAFRKCRRLSFKEYNEKVWTKSLNRSKVFSTQKMISFFKYFGSLKVLTLSDIPHELFMDDMLEIGKAVPTVEKLTLIQKPALRWIGAKAILGLSTFTSLKKLKLDGWEPSKVWLRGSNPQYEMIPIETFEKLENITIKCDKDTISDVLRYVLDNQVVMKNCLKAKFNVRLSASDMPYLVMKFVEVHPHIQSISINGFLFTTKDQVTSFYNHLLALPSLRNVSMENCSVVERLENAIQRKFFESFNRRGININNLVKSLRYG